MVFTLFCKSLQSITRSLKYSDYLMHHYVMIISSWFIAGHLLLTMHIKVGLETVGHLVGELDGQCHNEQGHQRRHGNGC